ncbi:MAG TPA: hypothetical protein PK431_17355 [Chitinophagales bacterium]|nr:hypothetical protein [Chitinophagales bacterium]
MADYYTIQVRVNQFVFNKFKEYKKKGFTAKEILEQISCPCNESNGIEIVTFNEDGEQVKIPRGILTRKK